LLVISTKLYLYCLITQKLLETELFRPPISFWWTKPNSETI